MQTEGQSVRLSEPRIRLFVAILMQNETVFNQFKGSLTVDVFAEESHRLLYRVLLDSFAAYQTLPSFVEIWTELQTYLLEDPDIVSEEAKADLQDFYEFATDPVLFHDFPPTAPKFEAFAFSMGKALLLRHRRSQLQRQLQVNSDLNQLPFMLQQAQVELDALNISARNAKATYTYEPDWDKNNPKIIRTTGLGFLDKYLGGGTSAGEAYGLMAPYGTCKTTLAVMLWCTTAQQCYEESLLDDWDGRKGLTVLVTYEASRSPEIQHRALMYAARVSRYSLDKMGLDGMSALLNDPDKPLPYEQARFAQEISDGVFEPELARVQRVIPCLNSHTLCLDFSGADKENPTAGSGGVLEILHRIDVELRHRGPEYYVRNVIIDYLGLMVDRDTTAKVGNKQKEDHKAYQEAVVTIVNEVSKKLDCHTWILHQLSGSANAMLSATKTLHHTDAKGSKSFAENLDFAMVIGNLNHDSMGQLACTKHRRFRRMPPSVIKVEGEFNLVLAPDNFHVDGKGNIVDKSTMTTAGMTVPSDQFANVLGLNSQTSAAESSASDSDDSYGEEMESDIGAEDAVEA
jgi:hypothetical protein